MKIIYSIILSAILLASLSSSVTNAFPQSPTRVCAEAAFTPPLPQPFTNGTSFPFTADFGTSFSTISEAKATSTYDSAAGFGDGDYYEIEHFGGQDTQPGESDVTTINQTLNVADPIIVSRFLNQFVDGTYQDTYIDRKGQFTLTSLKLCITGEEEPLPPGVCPAKYVQHWNTITFQITSPILAEIVDQQNIGDYAQVTVNSTLQYIEKTSPGFISLPHEKIIEKIFPNSKEYRNIFEKFIKIMDIDYSTLCAEEYSGTAGDDNSKNNINIENTMNPSNIIKIK
jgi:hypothetical protein